VSLRSRGQPNTERDARQSLLVVCAAFPLPSQLFSPPSQRGGDLVIREPTPAKSVGLPGAGPGLVFLLTFFRDFDAEAHLPSARDKKVTQGSPDLPFSLSLLVRPFQPCAGLHAAEHHHSIYHSASTSILSSSIYSNSSSGLTLDLLFPTSFDTLG
jgi:hypothetical protein